MTKEPTEEVGTVPETCERAIHLDTHLVGRCRGGIPEMLFDIAMAPLLGIQIRRIGWEPFHVNVGMRSNIVLDDDGAMRV
jgi:hypothetical protein